MTTSRDRVIKALNREPVDRVPRQLWASSEIESTRGDELAEMVFRYPNDIVRPDFHFPRGKLSKGGKDSAKVTDAWGCTWQRGKRGAPPEIVAPPLTDAAAVAAFQPPIEIVDGAKPEAMNRACSTASQFVLASAETRLLDRLKMLRGSQAALADLNTGGKPVRRLLAALDEFACREMEFWAASNVDGVVIHDDWGDDAGLVLPKQAWRELFRPRYREYCGILHAGDKFVVFQSAGRIEELFGDLVQIEVDAIQAQFSRMDLEKLGTRYRGKVAFWGGIDPAGVLQGGSPLDVRNEVDRIRRAFDFNCGGLIAQCEWRDGVPFDNINAFFERWLEPLLTPA